MYYQTQVRNLAQQAELQHQLLAVKYLENKVLNQNYEKLRESKRMTPSRREKDKETAIHLARSRIQSELDANKVSTNAILNRSRIQSALENRQRKQQLNFETKKTILQEQQNIAAQIQAQRQLFLQNQRQRDLILLNEHNASQDIYKKILREQEERIYNEVKRQDIRRQVYEQEIKRQLDRKYDLLTRPFSYY